MPCNDSNQVAPATLITNFPISSLSSCGEKLLPEAVRHASRVLLDDNKDADDWLRSLKLISVCLDAIEQDTCEEITRHAA